MINIHKRSINLPSSSLRRSRLGSKFSLIEEEHSDNRNDNILKENLRMKKVPNILKVFPIVQVSFATRNKNGILHMINIPITKDMTIRDLIKRSLDTINDLLINSNAEYIFNKHYEKYSIYPSKKTGRANYDLPST